MVQNRVELYLHRTTDSDGKLFMKSGQLLYEMFSSISQNALFYNGDWSGKVIWNLHLGPDHHQKLIYSSDRYAQS